MQAGQMIGMWNLNKVAVQPGPVQSVCGISHNLDAHIGEEMWRQENPQPLQADQADVHS